MIASPGGSDRDVVMRLKLVADSGNQSEARRVFDDVAAARKTVAREGETAIQREAQQQAKAGEQTEQIDARVFKNRAKLLAQIQQAKAKAAADEAKAEQAALREQEQARKAAADASAQNAANQIKVQQTIQREAERAGKIKVAAELQAKEAAFAAGRGALDAVRGMAILGLATEDDVQKFAKLFAKIEGGFALVRGLTDLWMKGGQAVRMYQTALAAAEAQQVALNAAGAASAATNAGGVASGGGAVAAGGAGLGATLGIAAGVLALTDMIAGMNDPTQSYIFTILGLADSTKELRRVQEQQAAAAAALVQQNQKDLDERRRFQSQRNDATAGAVGIRNRLAGVNALTAEDQLALSREDLASAQGNVARVEDWRSRFRGSDRDQMMAADRVEADAQREVQAAYERMADAQQRIIDGKRESLQLAERELATAERQVETAQKRLDSERKGFQSRLAAFGELDESTRNRIAQIAAKVKAGITPEESEIRLLKQHGQGRDVTEKFFAQRAGAQGEEVQTIFGERRALDESLAELAKAQQARRDAELAAAKATAEMQSAITDLIPVLQQMESVMRRIPEIENRFYVANQTGEGANSGIGLAERRRGNEGRRSD